MGLVLLDAYVYVLLVAYNFWPHLGLLYGGTRFPSQTEAFLGVQSIDQMWKYYGLRNCDKANYLVFVDRHQKTHTDLFRFFKSGIRRWLKNQYRPVYIYQWNPWYGA